MKKRRTRPLIGELVWRRRTELGLSQGDLALKAGVSVRTIQRMETDGTAAFETCHDVAPILELEVAELTRLLPQGKGADVQNYLANFVSAAAGPAAVAVPLSTASGDDLWLTLHEGLVPGALVVLTAPPGAGKSLLSLAFALEHTRSGGVAVFARARSFSGDVTKWLDAAAAAHARVTFADLAEHARRGKVMLVLVVDGANECAPGIRDELFDGLAAIRLSQQDLGTLVTTQAYAQFYTPPGALRVVLSECSADQKRRILVAHDPEAPEAVIDEIGWATTPFDIAVAAKVWRRLRGRTWNRYMLRHEWIWESLEQTGDPDVCWRALRQFAVRLNESVRFAAPIHEFRTLCEAHALTPANGSALAKLRASSLLQGDAGYISFAHQNLQDLCLVDELLSSFQSVDELRRAIDSPTYEHVAGLVLEAQEDPARASQLIQLSATVHRMLAEIASGWHGIVAQRVLVERFSEAFERAIGELSKARLSVVNKQVELEGWELDGVTHAILHLAGQFVSSDRWVVRILDFLGQVDRWIARRAQEVREHFEGSARVAEAYIAHAVYAPYSKAPAAAVAHPRLMRSGRNTVPSTLLNRPTGMCAPANIRSAVLSRDASAGQVFFLAQWLRQRIVEADGLDGDWAEIVLGMLRVAWRSSWSLARTEVLEMIHLLAMKLSDESRERIRVALEALPAPKDPFVGSSFLEALEALGAELNTDSDDQAFMQFVEELLGRPDSEDARRAASGVVSQQFEPLDAISRPAFEAIQALARPKQVRLLAMAALGADDIASSLDHCVLQLWRCSPAEVAAEPLVLEAFRKWASTPSERVFSPRERALSFLISNAALGRFGLPQRYEEGPSTLRERAWRHWATILHGAGTGELNSQGLLTAWAELEAGLAREALEGLRLLAHAVDMYCYRDTGSATLPDIFRLWPQRVQQLLIRLLRDPDVADIPHPSPLETGRSAVIELLGRLDGHEARDGLALLANDPQDGSAARAAIGRMDERLRGGGVRR